MRQPADRTNILLAAAAAAGIASHLVLRFLLNVRPDLAALPLIATLLCAGAPAAYGVFKKLAGGEASADVLALISIAAAVWLKEYLAGTIVVLMLTTGAALESHAVAGASAVLGALARRMPAN